jgi:hypothetical protein
VGLAYANLIPPVRVFMLEEINMAVADGTIYLSPWLSPQGLSDWIALLLDSARSGTDDALAAQLRQNGRINKTAQRRKPKGGFTTYSVPYTASETMAEGEFNRFYVRGLCRHALANGIAKLQVYRAKQVAEPRPGSEEKIGSLVDPQAILDDLRKSAGVEPTLGMPPGPNSGLTLKIP